MDDILLCTKEAEKVPGLQLVILRIDKVRELGCATRWWHTVGLNVLLEVKRRLISFVPKVSLLGNRQARTLLELCINEVFEGRMIGTVSVT